MKNIILFLFLLSCATQEQRTRSISSTDFKTICGKVVGMNSEENRVEFQQALEESKKRKLNVSLINNLQNLISLLPTGSSLIKDDDNGILVGDKHSIHKEDNSSFSQHLMKVSLSSLEDIGKSFLAMDTNGYLCFSGSGGNSTLSIREDTF